MAVTLRSEISRQGPLSNAHAPLVCRPPLCIKEAQGLSTSQPRCSVILELFTAVSTCLPAGLPRLAQLLAHYLSDSLALSVSVSLRPAFRSAQFLDLLRSQCLAPYCSLVSAHRRSAHLFPHCSLGLVPRRLLIRLLVLGRESVPAHAEHLMELPVNLHLPAFPLNGSPLPPPRRSFVPPPRRSLVQLVVMRRSDLLRSLQTAHLLHFYVRICDRRSII